MSQSPWTVDRILSSCKIMLKSVPFFVMCAYETPFKKFGPYKSRSTLTEGNPANFVACITAMSVVVMQA